MSEKQSIPTRPYSPKQLRIILRMSADDIYKRKLTLGPDDYVAVDTALGNLVESEKDVRRYCEYLTGTPYLDEMDEDQIIAMLRILKPRRVGDTWVPCDEAIEEAKQIAALPKKDD